METSTPETNRKSEQRTEKHQARALPVIVPETTVPFFNSIVTDSLFSFIKNLNIINKFVRVTF